MYPFHIQCVFDYQPGDVFACIADLGWITGHSYVVYGPLCNGATTVLFESTHTYPHAGMLCSDITKLVHTDNTHTYLCTQDATGIWWTNLKSISSSQFHLLSDT